jgi:hypothetical protein
MSLKTDVVWILCWPHLRTAFMSTDVLVQLYCPRGQLQGLTTTHIIEVRWNVMTHAQKPDFVFRAGRTESISIGPAGGASVESTAGQPRYAASAVVMLDTACSEVVWRVLATHCIRQFPPSLPLPRVTVCHHISTGVYCCRISSFGETDQSI